MMDLKFLFGIAEWCINTELVCLA